VRVDDPPRRPTLTDEEEPRHARRSPPKTARHQRRKSHFAIEHHQGRLQIPEGRLHLDDQEDLLDGMPRQDVDGAALAADLEAHLGLGHPPSTDQASHGVVDQRRVGTVEEPIDRLAAPIHPNVHTRLERPPDPLDHVEPKLASATEFE
jgi:hypothetical protein